MSVLKRVYRKKLNDEDYIEGFIIDESKNWVLLSFFDDDRYDIDGYSMLNKKYITSITQAPKYKIKEQVVKLKDIKIGEIDVNLELESGKLIFELSNLYDIIDIYTEVINYDICHLGSVVDFDSKSISINTIDINAKVLERNYIVSIEDITRIDFEGSYSRGMKLAYLKNNN